jgi:Ca2+-binding EF-hand superfamily protein
VLILSLSLCCVIRGDIIDIFEVVDLDDSDIIELKEFLVALTVAYALGLITLSQSQKLIGENDDGTGTISAGVANGVVTGNDVKSVCNLILSAYLLFDPNGQGFITRKGVEKMIADGKNNKGGRKEGGNRNLLLNENRWKEMVRTVTCTSIYSFC